MLDASKARGVVSGLKSQLADGSAVSVAGYDLSPGLANPLASTRLTLPDDYDGAVSLLEILPNAEAPPSPAIAKIAKTWRDTGIDLDSRQAIGPAFWRTAEIETLPELINITVIAAEKIAP